MKKALSLSIILLLIFISCTNKNQCNTNEKIAIGTISQNWLYENKQFGFSLQLPNKWYFIDNRGIYSKSIPMTMQTPNKIFITDSVTINGIFDIKNERETLVTVFVISDSIVDGRQPLSDKQLGCNIGFAITMSQNQDANQDVEDIKKEYISALGSNQDFMNLNGEYLKSNCELPFGKNEKIPCIKIAIKTSNGNLRTKVNGFKNFGCYNLIITATYNSEEELKQITNILQQIKL